MTNLEMADAKARQLEAAAQAAKEAAAAARAEANRLADEEKKAAKRLADEKMRAAKRLRLTSHYSFYDDNGHHKAWAEGAVADNLEEVRLLIARGAPVERIEA